MNRKEISEIRRRFNPDSVNISCLRGCYVNEKREVISTFNLPPSALPREESDKYMAIFKRILSGIPGKNQIDIVYSPEQVMQSEEHKLLMELRDTKLQQDDVAFDFFQRVIDSLTIEGNYLILMLHDTYDVPGYRHGGQRDMELSDTVFPYVVCCVCPVKLTKPALSYCAADNIFHERTLDWVVGAPELGFMFPTFDDRAANIYNALYYTRDAAECHDEFVAGIFHTEMPMPAPAQKEAFQAILQDTLAEDCNLDVVQTVHEQLRARVEEQKKDKEADLPTVSGREVRAMLETCGVPVERAQAFEEKYDEQFGLGTNLSAVSIVDTKQFEVRTPNVVIHVDPEHSDMIETRVIDGFKYILIRAEDNVEVNGVDINIIAE